MGCSHKPFRDENRTSGGDQVLLTGAADDADQLFTLRKS